MPTNVLWCCVLHVVMLLWCCVLHVVPSRENRGLKKLFKDITYVMSFLCSVTELELQPLRAQLEELEAKIVEQVSHQNRNPPLEEAIQMSFSCNL